MRALPASRPLHRANFGWVIRTTAIVLILGVLVAYAVLAVAAVASHWYFYDARGYLETGWRLRNGGELYPPLVDQDHPSVYRYAPWFAWLWTALTFLPESVVLLGWGALLTAGSVWLLWQLPRSTTGLAIGLIFGPMLLRVISQGNVQPIMVAALAWGLTRRSGPMWIALAASLKLVPLLFAVLYVARREYGRAVSAAVLTLVLWIPALIHGIDDYPTSVGGEAFPFGWLTFAFAGAALLAVLVVPARFRGTVAALAVLFASPRWIPYNPSYLLVGPVAHPRQK